MRRHLKKEMATWAVLVAAALLAARAASAHEFPLQSVLNAFVRLEPDRAELIIRIPLHLLAGADFPAEANRELQLDQSDPASGRALAVIAQTIQLREDGALLVPSLAVGRLSLPSDRSFESYEEATAWIGRGTDRTTPVYADQGYFDAHLTYPIRAPSSEFTLQTSLVPEMRDHLKLYVRFLTLDGSARLFEITSVSGAVALDPRWHQAVVVFVREGFLHILSGIDHLLFLLALAVPFYRARLVTLLPIVTSFTLAHSVTLIASAYGGVPAGEWFAPLVETLIAASIVYMALENVLAADLGRRWLVTLAFGLVHGFGFAAGLTQTLQFAGSHLLLALVSFNVGIELGQVAFLMAVVPLLRLVLGRLATAQLAAVVLSLLIGHQAWHWLLERADRLQRIEWPTPDGPTLVVLARLLVAVLAAGGLAWLAARGVGRRRDSALTRSTWATTRHVDPPCRDPSVPPIRRRQMLSWAGLSGLALLIVIALAPDQVAAAPNCGPGEVPSFTGGFATLARLLGPRMGQPTECPSRSSGSFSQRTSTGIVTYLSADVEPAFATDWINDRAQSWALLASDGFVYVFSPSATQHSDPIAAFTDSECAAISSDAPSETMTAYCRQVRQDTLLYSPRVVATIYPPAPFCEPGQEPQFSSGFAALREELGDAMGTPTECEHPNSSNGDTLQATTKGLAFYRKSTNTPTFTDGSTHWGITSDGLISWAGTSVDPPGVAVAAPAAPSAPPTPKPSSPVTPVPTAGPVRPVPPVALHAWTVPSGGAILVDPRLDETMAALSTWELGRQLIIEGVNRGVRAWIQPMAERPGTRVFADYSTFTHDIRINGDEMWGSNAWVVAGTVAHELQHASDDLAGVPIATSTKACYDTEARALAVMVNWDEFARGHFAQTTGPMVAELWELGVRWDYRVYLDDPDGSRLFLDKLMNNYGESCGGRPQP